MSSKDEDRKASDEQGEAGSTRAVDPDEAVVVYTTFPSLSDARKAGRFVVEQGMAACVNIFPGMLAIFSWEDKTDEAEEVAMIVKTARSRVDDVLDAIKRLHPYTLPARLVLPVAGGGHDFLRWIIRESTRSPDKSL